MNWLSVEPSQNIRPFNSTQFNTFLPVPLLIWVASLLIWLVAIIRFKAKSVWLDLPTGTELGKIPDNYRIPAHNPKVSKIFRNSRDWCHSIVRERSRLFRMVLLASKVKYRMK